MDAYYITRETNNLGGHNEVHKSDCQSMPSFENRIFLGNFTSCNDAIDEAEKHFPNNTDGCNICCPRCHHG
jgi:hypothetical protein